MGSSLLLHQVLATIYLIFGIAFLLAAVKTIMPRLGGQVVGAGWSLVGLSLALYAPQLAGLGIVLTIGVGWWGALLMPMAMVGLALHVLGWGIIAVYLRRLSVAPPLLDGQPVDDQALPFASLPQESRGLPSAQPKGSDDTKTDIISTNRPSTPPLPKLESRILWSPFLTLRMAEMADVGVRRAQVYREVDGVRLRADIYRRRSANGPQPTLIYIHGGGWVTGTRRQARFMCYQLAQAGWTVFAISYRLAPRFPLPAAIEDCKAAIAWIREEGRLFGADPGYIAVIGGSAGGHLAGMMALTPNAPEFQPGFESANTRVQAAVLFYPVTEFVSAFEGPSNPGMALILERFVCRKPYGSNKEFYHRIQPWTYIRADAPPLLIVHGTHDRLVPIGDSRRFVAKLKEEGARKVHFLELPHAMHAFDVTPAPVQQRTVHVVANFLAQSLAEYRAGAEH